MLQNYIKGSWWGIKSSESHNSACFIKLIFNQPRHNMLNHRGFIPIDESQLQIDPKTTKWLVKSKTPKIIFPKFKGAGDGLIDLLHPVFLPRVEVFCMSQCCFIGHFRKDHFWLPGWLKSGFSQLYSGSFYLRVLPAYSFIVIYLYSKQHSDLITIGIWVWQNQPKSPPLMENYMEVSVVTVVRISTHAVITMMVHWWGWHVLQVWLRCLG